MYVCVCVCVCVHIHGKKQQPCYVYEHMEEKLIANNHAVYTSLCVYNYIQYVYCVCMTMLVWYCVCGVNIDLKFVEIIMMNKHTSE